MDSIDGEPLAQRNGNFRVPNLQDRMYSLMRCVNNNPVDVVAPNGSGGTDGNKNYSTPSLSHWLVRDHANGGKEDDERSGTLTPGATPTKHQQQSKQESPQYSQIVKKQAAPAYVEHWLDAHASGDSQSSEAEESHHLHGGELMLQGKCTN